ncbi:uncharacterized protein ISCGN_008889 [Ixodes scapularis]
MSAFHLLQALLAVALAVAPLARPTFTDSRGNTATWILSMSDQVASEQLQAVPHLGQLNLALSHLGVWQLGTSCEPHHRSLQKPARSASQLGHDVTAGTVMSTFYLLQSAVQMNANVHGRPYEAGRYGREARNCMGRSGAGRDDIRQPSWTLWNLLSFLKHQIHPRASKKPQMALEQANLVVAPEASGGLSPVTPTAKFPFRQHSAFCRPYAKISKLLMRAYTPIPDPDECPEATDKEIPDTDTSDSLQDDLQLSSTCQLLLQLEQNNHMPSSSQLVPPQCAPSGAHPTLTCSCLPPASCSFSWSRTIICPAHLSWCHRSAHLQERTPPCCRRQDQPLLSGSHKPRSQSHCAPGRERTRAPLRRAGLKRMRLWRQLLKNLCVRWAGCAQGLTSI